MLLCSIAVVSCTVDDQIVTEIGTTQLRLADSQLLAPIVTSTSDFNVQTSVWTVDRAELILGGRVIDLTFGEDCTFIDSYSLSAPAARGACASGVVVDADETVRLATLRLTFVQELRRAEPADLPPLQDFDGDGVSNGNDNCPLIDNPDQLDSAGTGFGDACTFTDPFFGGRALDNDRDRVIDGVDNCPQVDNPNQGDEVDDLLGIGDGIGDACAAEIEPVDGGAVIELMLGPIDVLQPLNRPTFLVVDFRNRESFEQNQGLPGNCWNGGGCTLDTSVVRFCVLTSPFAPSCP